MLNKMEFIMSFTKIISGETMSDDAFNCIVDILKMQRMVLNDYIKDEASTQAQNILNMICQNSVQFYETYLGQ